MPELSTDLLPTSPIPSGNSFPQTSGATGPVPQASPQSYFQDTDPAGNRTPQSLQDLVDSYDSQKQSNQPNDIQESISNKELKDNSRYGIYRQGADNEDIAAENQSGWDRAANAGWQFVNKFGAYLAQTVGFIGGAVGAAAGGTANLVDKWAGGDGKVVNDGNAVSLMTDNFMTQLGDVWKDAVQNSNPIYKTDKYTNGNIWQKLGTTSWWLDDFVDRAALTASMFVPGILEAKGLGMFGAVVREGGALEATGLGAKAIQTFAQNPDMYGTLGKVLGNAVSKAAVDGTVDLGADAAMNFKNMIKGAQNIELTTFNVIGQNALNGREAQTSIRKSLTDQRDQGLNNLSDSDIENKAAQGAVASFWYNMPLTALSSLWELPQVFSSMKGGMDILKKVGNVNSMEELVDGIKSFATNTVKPTLLKTIGKAAITGLEHGQLESSQVAIGRYIENAIAGKNVNDKNKSVAEENQPFGFWNVDTNLLGSFKEYINNFSDPNGQNNIALGTIQGMLTTIFGRAYKSYKGDYKVEDARNRDFADRLTESIGQRKIFNALTDMIVKNPDGSVKMENNKPVFDQTKLTELGASYVNHIKDYYDRLDALKNNDKTAIEQMNFNSLRDLSQDFFQDAKGKEYLTNVLRFEQKNQNDSPDRANDVVNGVEQTPNTLLNENISYVNDLYKAYNAIDQRHGGFTKLKVDYKNPDEVNDHNFFVKNLKSTQYNEAANQIFYNNKLLKNNTELLSLGGDPNTRIESPSSPSEERINEIIDENERLNKNLAVSKETYKFFIDKDNVSKLWESKKKQAEDIREKDKADKEEDTQEEPSPTAQTSDDTQKSDSKSDISDYLSSIKDTNPALGDVADEYNNTLSNTPDSNLSKTVDSIHSDIDQHVKNINEQKEQTSDEETKNSLQEYVDKLNEMRGKIGDFFSKYRTEKLSNADVQKQIEIVNNLVDKTHSRLQDVKSEIEKKSHQLNTILDDIKSLRDKIENEKSTKEGRFKSTTKRALGTISRLTDLKSTLENELANLNKDKEDTEYNLSYFKDVANGIDNLSIDSKNLLEQLNDHAINLEIVREGIEKSAKQITSLIGKVEKALDSALNLVRDAIDKFEKLYHKTPTDVNSQAFVDFLKKNPNFLKLKPNYIGDIKTLEKYIAQVEDLDIIPNERTVAELQKDLEDLQKNLDSTSKQYEATLELIKAYNDSAEEIKQEAEDTATLITKSKEELDKIQQGNVDIDVVTPNLTQEEFPKEEPKKNLYQITRSTIEPVIQSMRLPYMDRHQSFLSNFDTLPNKGAIQAIKVTKTNEEEWGLSGLINLINNGYLPSDKLTDKIEGIVALVYVTKNSDGSISFIDKNGKIAKEDLLNNAVFSVMGNAKEKTVTGETKARNNEDPEEVKKAFEDYANEREDVFKRDKANTELQNFVISAGQAITDKGAQNPVVGSLLTKEQLNQKGLLKVSTTGRISNNNGESREVPLGTPAIVTPSGIYFLNNRLFNSDEAKNITDILKKLAEEFQKTGTYNPAIVRYLQGQFQWVTPGPNSKVANNQMYIDEFAQSVVIGTNEKGQPDYLSLFHPDAIERNRKEIEGKIQTKYNNVNNKFLTTEFEQPYNELSVVNEANKQTLEQIQRDKKHEIDKARKLHDEGIDETVEVGQEYTKDNIDKFSKIYQETLDRIDKKYDKKIADAKSTESSIISKEWKSYQEYLLSSEGGKTPPLTTRVRMKEKDSLVNNDYNIMKYSTLEDVEVPQIEEKKPAIVSKVKPTVNKEQSAIEAKKADIERKKEELRLFKTPNQIIQKSRQELYDKWLPIAMEDTKLSEKELIEKIDKEGIIKKAQKEYNEGNHLSNLQQFAIYLNTTRHSIEEVRQEKEQYNKIVAELAALEQPTIKEGASMTGNNVFKVSSGEDISYTIDKDGNIELVSNKELGIALKKVVDDGTNIEEVKELMKKAGIDADDKTAAAAIIKDEIETGINKVEKQVATVESVDNMSLDDIAKGIEAIPTVKNSNTVHKTISSLDVKRMTPSDHVRFAQWMKVNLPNVPFERVSHIINKVGGGYAWGVFQDGMIKIFSDAERGTEYHEAFEAVWNSFLSKEEQNGVLAEYRKTHKDSQNLSDEEIKEKIADDFGDYILSSTPTTFGAKIRKFFNDLISFFKGLINKPGAIDSLFKRINTGYYSAAEINGNSQAAYHSIKDLSQEIVNESIDHVTASMMRDLADKGAGSFFPESFKGINLSDLYTEAKARLFSSIKDVINNKLEQYKNASDGEKPVIEADIRNLYATKLNIDKQWNKIIYEQIDYLRAFNINVDDSDEEAEINDDNRNSVDFNLDSFKVDPKTSAPSAIKLLFATLTNNIYSSEIKEGQVLQLPKESVSPSIGGMQTAPFAKSFIQVMEALSGQNSIYNQIDNLVNLAKKEPNFVKLFTRLGGSLTTGKIDLSKLDKDGWRLLISHYSAFTKQKPVSFLQYVGENGTYVQEADLNNVIANTVSSWMPSIRNTINKENSIIKYNSKDDRYSIDFRRKGQEKQVRNNKLLIPIDNPAQQVSFLNRIGIPFTIEQYNDIREKDKTDPREYTRLREFSDAISSIRSTLATLPNTNKLTQKWLNVSKPLNIISRLTNSIEVPEESSILFDGDNNMRQKYVLHNYLSVFANEFNNVKTLTELKQLKPYLNDVFSTNSQVLKLGGQFFDEKGNRTSKKLQTGNILSSLNTTNGKNTSLAKLTLPDRIMLEFNMNLKGWSYNLSTSDSGTEWLLNLGNNIPETSFFLPEVWNTVSGIFKGYLADEIALIQDGTRNLEYTKGKEGRLRFMGDILSPTTTSGIESAIKSGKIDKYLKDNSDRINNEIKDYFVKKADATINKLTNANKILTSISGNSFEVPGLDNSHKTNMNNTELKSLFQFLTVNNVINSFELHKVYYGDPFQFKIKYNKETGKPILDEVKRIKSSGSSKELPLNNAEFDTRANVEYNKSGKVALANTDIGYTKFKPYANTVTIKDIIVRGSLAEENANYAKVNEADASGWQSFPFYRQMQLKRGTWSNAAEEFYQYDMAAARRYFDGNSNYEYKYSSEELRSIDDTLLNSPRPDYKVDVSKPLAYGPEYNKTENNLIFDKDSEIPLTFDLASFTGKAMLDIFFKMHDDKGSDGNPRDYFIVETGRKVGIPTNSDSLYAKDGSVNKEPFKTDTKVDLNSKGTQVESAYKEKQQTVGKQMRVLTLQDIFDKGKALSEDLDKLAKNYTNTLNNLTRYGYNNILNSFGIIDNKDHFTIEDKSILAETLRKELLKQAVSDNVKQAVRLDDNGNFPVAFEATNVYDKIRNTINSIINRNLISQKVNGSAKTQITSTLFERNNRQAVYKKGDNWVKVEDYDKLTDSEKKTVMLTSSELKFYPVDKDVNGKITKVYHMEVYLPRWFGNKSKMSDDELINHLNSTEEGQKVLKGIAFRIPTQKKNSIEAFIVKGFLPQSMGNSVVVPSEITMKAGSDFDYDKLNTYLKNVVFDKNGLPGIAKFDDIKDTNDEEQLRDFYHRNLSDRYIKFSRKEKEVSAEQAASTIFKDIFGEEDSLDERSPLQGLKNSYTPSVDEFINTVKGKDARFINEEYNPGYKAVLENEFFQATEDLLLHPDLYERLIKPNEAGGSFPDLRDKVIKAVGNDSGLSQPSMIDVVYRATMRHNAKAAEGGIGIVASNITLYTKLQQVNSFLDSNKLSQLSKADKIFVHDLNILLNHNTTDVNGRNLPTLSGLRDVLKGYISDNLSNLADGMVDITKDPWITELFGDNSNMHSTAIFMTMLGMKPETTAYFLNQPIIREYRKSLSATGKTYMLDKDARDNLNLRFSSIGPNANKINENNLLSNIEKYYKDKNSLTNAEKAEQRLILDEFLKYVSLSGHLYGLNSAISYDSKLKGNSSFDTKKINTDKQRTVNLISGVDDILGNTFLGTLADNLDATHNALSEIFPLMKADIRNMFNSIRSSIDVKFMTSDNKQKISDGIQKSFIDYLIQTQTKYFTQDINKLLINPETSVANQLRDAKDSGLNNSFVNALSEIADRKGLMNVKLDKKDTDVFTTNSYIASFRQLKQQNRDLYNNLIKLAIIQSGTQMSKLAYTYLIPLEDYQLIAGDVLSKIDIIPNIKDFQINNAYFRNNWNDNTIVPPLKGDSYFNNLPKGVLSLSSLTGSSFAQIDPNFGNKASYPVVKSVTYTRDGNGKSIPSVTLYQKVMQDVQNQIPFITNNGKFLYKQINGWGDSIYLQEYYNNVRPSQYTDSNLVRIDNELVDKDIVDAYTKGMDKMQSTTTDVEDNSVPLKKGNMDKIDISNSTRKSPFFQKDISKFKNANKLISRGSKNSSSEAYRIAAGDKSNVGEYNSNDIVAVSAEGNRSGRIKPNYAELEKAVNANATFITDNTSDRNRDYNIGEREVADYLMSKGYSEQGDGVWTKDNQYGPDDLPKLNDENKDNC